MYSTAGASERPPRILTVKVVADSRFARQTAWKRKAREEMEKAAPLILDLIGVKVHIADFELWEYMGDNNVFDLVAKMADTVSPDSADLIVGFTLFPHPAGKNPVRIDGATIPHKAVMIAMYQGTPDGNLFTPYVILHEMIHAFGGVHVSGHTIMSPLYRNAIEVVLDPLNRSIVNLTHDIDFGEGYGSLTEDKLNKLSRLYERAVSSGNEEASTLLELGAIYDALSGDTLAEQVYDKIISLHPAVTEGWLRLAEYYERHTKPDSAVAVLEKGLSVSEDKGRLYHRLAILYYNSKVMDKARCYADSALKNGEQIDSAFIDLLRK